MGKPTPSATLLVFLALGILTADARAQLDPENVPEPPVERLQALQPFFGLYAHTDQEYAGMAPWNGTLEVGPALKSWYVEFVVETHHGPIDRQLRMILTWDRELERYRIWRFETTPQQPPGTVEGEARFVGDTLVMVWEGVPGPRGGTGTFRNRVFMEGPDELVIISDALPDGATQRIRLGEWHNRRKL